MLLDFERQTERAQKRGEKVERERERERKDVVFFVVLSSFPLWFKKRPKKDQTKQKREYLKAQHHP